jgi:hypothetical protein
MYPKKKMLSKQLLWLCVIIVNIAFFSFMYNEIQLRAQRYAYNVGLLVMSKSTFNKNNYLFQENGISIENIIGNKQVMIYGLKHGNEAKFNTARNCENSIWEYSRRNINLNNIKKDEIYQINMSVPLLKILQTFLQKDFEYNSIINVNNVPMTLRVKYMNICNNKKDWIIN